jgi:hypothetical protein
MEMKAKFIFSGIALMALTAMVYAQEPGTGRGLRNGTGKGPAYVDVNKNNVCDNYENNSANFSRHRRNGAEYKRVPGRRAGQGLIQNQGRGRGQGRSFVDADKNGICDRFDAATKK